MEDDMAKEQVSIAEETVRNIRARHARNTRGRRRSVLSWKDYEARCRLPGCAGGKESARVCAIAGARSIWRLASSGWWVTQSARLEVTDLHRENEQLKQLVAELALKNRVLKKSVLGMGSEWED